MDNSRTFATHGTASPFSASPWRDLRWEYVGLFLALSVVVQWPLWSTRYPITLDFPNHYARMYLLVHGGASSVLSEYYDSSLAFVPNLGYDLFVLVASKFVSILTASKLFMGLTSVLLTTGVVALNLALFGRTSVLALAGFLLLHSRCFWLGFLSYLFGLGVMLWALALSIVASRSGNSWIRLGVPLTFAIILYVVHLAALGVFGLALLAYYISRRAEYTSVSTGAYYLRAFGELALIFALPATWHLFVRESIADSPFVIEFETRIFIDKVLWLFSLMDGGRPFELIFGAFSAGLILMWLLKRPELRVARFTATLLVLALVLYLFLPEELFGSGYLFHRIPLAVGFIFFGGCLIELPRASMRVGLAAFITVLLGFQVWTFQRYWERSNRTIEEYELAYGQMSEGARMFYKVAEQGRFEQPPLRHISAYALANRHAFIQNLFALPRYSESVTYQPAYHKRILRDTLRHTELHSWEKVDWAGIVDFYDYVLLSNPSDFKPGPPATLQIVFRGSIFNLYINCARHADDKACTRSAMETDASRDR